MLVMRNNKNDDESNLQADLAKPAMRALAGAGIVRLEQFAEDNGVF